MFCSEFQQDLIGNWAAEYWQMVKFTRLSFKIQIVVTSELHAKNVISRYTLLETIFEYMKK